MPAIHILLDALTDLLSRPQAARLGLMLLHFLWQGTLIAAAAEGSAVVLRLRPGRPRYTAYLLGMVVMGACPIATYWALPLPVVAQAAFAPETTSVAPAPYFGEAVPGAVDAEPQHTVVAGPRPATWDEIARTRLLSALPVALAVWAAGVAVLAARLLAGFVGVTRLRRGAIPLSPPLRQRVDDLARGLEARGFGGAFSSAHVSHPCAVGLWRPVLLLPAALLTGMPPELLEAVIAHELAHIRRLDSWVNLGQRVIETLLFYHPAVWWLSARVRREREVCCDDVAANAAGREACACALEHVARHSLGLPGARAEGLVLAFGRSTDLLYRVRHLLGTPEAGPRAGWPAGALALVVLGAGIAISYATSAAQAPLPAGTARETQPAPATFPAVEGTVSTGVLPTPDEVAREEARKQAARDVRRAELSVEEAQLTLDEKEKELDRMAKAHEAHTVSNEEFDRAKLDASLARIRLERSKLDLDDAQAKFQRFIPSSISVSAAMLIGHDQRRYNSFSRSFIVGVKQVTLKQLLGQVRDTLHEKFETQCIGRVTVTRDENTARRKLLDGVSLQEVLEGKAGDLPLRAGDTVDVTYERDVATNVAMTVHHPGVKTGSGTFGELSRRGATVTQVIRDWGIDPRSIPDAKITLERIDEHQPPSDPNRQLGGLPPDVDNKATHKVIDAVPMHDLLDGKVKDEVIHSNDRITIEKSRG